MKLEIQPLRARALADIRSKVTSENVVSEVFSWVTAGYVVISPDFEGSWYKLMHSFSQSEIMEMECDLLVSKFKDPRTIASVKEKIRHISDGSSSHQAGALQLGFEKAFESRAKRKRPGAVVCNRQHCSRRGVQVTCSSLFNNSCPSCKNYMECANCGQMRPGSYVSCTSCGVKFV